RFIESGIFAGWASTFFRWATTRRPTGGWFELYEYEWRSMHYLLIYDVAPDYLERRAQFRNEHLKLAWDANARGELVLGGALDEPVDGAVLLFQGDSPAAAEQFVASDPYVKNGLITRWRVRKWNTVVGKDAVSPVRGGQ